MLLYIYIYWKLQSLLKNEGRTIIYIATLQDSRKYIIHITKKKEKKKPLEKQLIW